MGPQNEEGAFIDLGIGELVLKLTMIMPDNAKKCNSSPALISFQIFKLPINRDFMNCCNQYS